VLQLLKRPDDAMRDLTEAIRLADIAQNSTVARQAYTQRGEPHRFGSAQFSTDLHATALLRRVQNDDEGALADFERAANLGSAMAKREAAKLNPYAQLCNQMVAVAMKAHMQETLESS